MRALIDAGAMKNAIDRNQLDILTFFISEPKRFAYIIHLLIDVNGRYFNLVRINLQRSLIISIFVLVRICHSLEKERYRSIIHQCTCSD